MSDPKRFRTLCELLRFRARAHGDRPLYTYLPEGGTDERTFTYADLHRRARSIGGWLADREAKGKRVLLVYPQGLEYIAAFFGCIYAGAIAVPAFPPRRNRRSNRLQSIVTDADVSIALTNADSLDEMQLAIAQERCSEGLTWQATDNVDASWAERWGEPDLDESSIAFLQYTSGSTGTPKGVMVSHGNLLHNQRLIHASFRQTESIVVAGWLPLYHDMGLIGNVLHPLYLGGRLVFLSPANFLQKPIRWLRTISRYRATIGGGPDFAYDLCVRGTTADQREGLDLSSWQVAYNGAEPVRGKTMADFTATFSEFGFAAESFCPCYGMAETTLLVTGATPREPVVGASVDAAALEDRRVVPIANQPPGASSTDQHAIASPAKTAELIACGIPDSSMDVRIVDPETGFECPSDQVGEIWVSGDSVTLGYWRNREATEEAYHARIRTCANGLSDHRYLRTGDLGFIHQRRLFVTGRLKDLIIFCGANHYPQDIERTVESSHECLELNAGAVFAIERDGTDCVVVVQELRRAHMRTFDRDHVFASIREAVADEHEIPLHAIVLIRPGAIPKTTSGKIQRSEARRLFLEGQYKIVASWENQADTASASWPLADPPARSTSPEDGHSVLATEAPALTNEQQSRIRELQEWMTSRLSERLQVPQEELDIRQPFARYGMDSLQAVRLTGELSDFLGRPVRPTLAYDFPNIQALSHFLVTGECHDAHRPDETVIGSEPLAVVGIGCRFPGSPSLRAYWDLLRGGRDAITAVPSQRWGKSLQNMAEAIGKNGKQVRRGGFVDNVDQFDAPFFGISPREADELDPQQRLLLEVTWETFEDAGIPLDHRSGSRTGVFVGISSNDYLRLQSALLSPSNVTARRISGYSATGNSLAMAANRISYTFDFRGPSLSVDTACSSSLVAVHQACMSLRLGECDMALAGGVNLILSPDATCSFVQAGMLSPTGACHTFASSADGFVRGEGCGLVLLKRLSRAVADGDRIYTLLRGSATNQDGRSNGITAPNGCAQQFVIRKALADAQVTPGEIDFVEAHGTGTELGDPIEMEAIAAVFLSRENRPTALRVGAVKTNIGHLEAAAGIAGLIKVCLALHHQAIPPNLHFDKPNPLIDWSLPLDVPTRLKDWHPSHRPRIAGVSSFGFGGTNAHVIVEEAPQPTALATDESHPTAATHLLALSAKTSASLKEQAARFAQVDVQTPVDDFCYAANSGRVHFKQRLAVPAAGMAEFKEKLASFVQSGTAPGLVARAADRDFSVNWLFSGQGGCHPGAGKRLYESHPLFRAELDRCAEVLAGHWPRPLTSILWKDERFLQKVDVQPALFCLQYSLARLWLAWGVKPRAVLGHSLGEYAAACVSGVFSMEDALRLVTRRAELIGQLPHTGRMLAVFAAEQEVRSCLSGPDEFENELDVAAVNGPKQTVVAGSERGINALQKRLHSAGFKTRALATTHAFHSPLIDPILDDFAAAAEKITFAKPQIPFVSSLTGDWIDEQIASPEYWRRHLRETVRFYAATKQLVASEGVCFLELGAGSTLSSLIRLAHPSARLNTLPGLTAKPDEWDNLLSNLAQLYVSGAEIDWRFVAGGPRPLVSLPTYAFQRKRHWFQDGTSGTEKDADSVGGQSVHPLLGRRLNLGVREIVFETDLNQCAYLADHRIGSAIVFPAAGFLELALAAGEADGLKRHQVSDLLIERPLPWEEDKSCRVQVVLSPQEDGFECRILHWDGDKWQRHAMCQLLPNLAEPETAPIAEPSGNPLEVQQHYRLCREAGLEYGPSFQALRRLVSGDGEAWGELSLSDDLSCAGYLLHPTLLDACFQVTAAALGERLQRAWLPFHVERYQLYNTPTPDAILNVHVRLLPDGDERTLKVDVQVADHEGERVAQIEKLSFRPTRKVDPRNLAYRECWIGKIRDRDPSPTLPDLSPSDLRLRLLDRREEIIQRTGVRDHIAFLDSLESLSAGWVIRALREMRAELRPGAAFTAEKLSAALGVVPDQLRLFHRILGILCEEGVLRADGADWKVIRTPSAADPDADCDRLLRDHPAGEPELTLLRRCASQLPQILRGESDPLPLLFPQDGAISAADVYRDSIGGRALNQMVSEAAGLAMEKLADGRGLRMLEIGAGTGATTEAVLAKLPPQRTRFTFTDIAPGFLAQARSKFHEFENVDYRVLDIERDPVEQGFPPHSFDMVIAANVLHATADLRTSLANVRRLLTAGGQLIIVEGTRPVRWLDLTFGLTHGWWRFQDIDLRLDYPLLSAAGWESLLDESGFEQSRVIHPLPVSEGGREPENSVIVTRLSETRDAAGTDCVPSSSERSGWVVLADRSGIGDALLNQLKDRGETYCTAYAKTNLNGHNASVRQPEIGLSELNEWVQPATASFSPRNIVFLWPLDFDHEETAPPRQALALNEALLNLVQAAAQGIGDPMHEGEQSLRLWIVTRGGQSASDDASQTGLAQSTVWGFARTLAFEYPNWQCRVVDLDPGTTDESAVQALLDEMTERSTAEEREVAFRDGLRLVRRVLAGDGSEIASRRESDETTVLEIAAPGTMEGLQLTPTPRRPPGDDEIEVNVHASGLNFRDVLNVLGLVPGSPPLGAECTGIVSRIGTACNDFSVGDRVVAIVPNSIRDVVTVPSHTAIQLPRELSMDEGATLPVAFLTAMIALEEIGEIRRGKRVLIHSAMGGVGLAAVQLAQHVGAEIFASASVSKHDALRDLGIEHIYDSREFGFAEKILAATSGAGVDLILNSLANEFLTENLQALGHGGRYLDIAHPDRETIQRAAEMRPDVVYHDIDLVDILEHDPDSIRTRLNEIIRRWSAGQLRALPFRSFALSDAPSAFRFMRSGKHVGKILIKPARPVSPDPPQAEKDVNRQVDAGLFRSEATYLITGGLGGLGLLVAKWLSRHGAAKIALLTQREPSELESRKVDEIQESGCRVTLLKADVADSKQLDAALHHLRSASAPLAGVFHMAGVLDDALLTRQTREKFARVFAPKVFGAWNLHQATRDDRLDHFVLFSSLASVFGSPGQANHAAANAFLDMLAWHRRRQGLPGLSINWGPWLNVGAAAARGVEKRGDIQGVGMLTPDEGLAVFQRQLQHGDAALPQMVGLRLDLEKLSGRMRGLPLLEMLCAQDSTNGRERDRRSPFLENYRAAPVSQRHGLLVAHLQNLVASTLGIDDSDSIPHGVALFELGLDSLTSLELRNALESSLQTKVSTTLVFDYPTLTELADCFTTILSDDQSEPQSPPAEEPQPNVEVSTPIHETRGTWQGPTSELVQGIHELIADLDRWEEGRA